MLGCLNVLLVKILKFYLWQNYHGKYKLTGCSEIHVFRSHQLAQFWVILTLAISECERLKEVFAKYGIILHKVILYKPIQTA